MSDSKQTEPQCVLELVFKPKEPGMRLRPAEIQLLLAYIGEILKEIENEEQIILAEQKNDQKEDEICK